MAAHPWVPRGPPSKPVFRICSSRLLLNVISSSTQDFSKMCWIYFKVFPLCICPYLVFSLSIWFYYPIFKKFNAIYIYRCNFEMIEPIYFLRCNYKPYHERLRKNKQNSYFVLYWTSGSEPQVIFAPEEIFCNSRCCWLPQLGVGVRDTTGDEWIETRLAAKHLKVQGQPLQHRIICLRMLLVPRLRNPALNSSLVISQPIWFLLINSYKALV